MELIDCIHRIPSVLKNIAGSQHEVFNQLQNAIDLKSIDEVVFIGSGSSMNAAKVTRYFAHKICKLNSQYFYPNEMKNYLFYENPKALYVFVSQGGETKLVFDNLQEVKRRELFNVSLTESLNSDIARTASVALSMQCGHEEYLYRTIGYSATVAMCMQIEMAVAIANGNLKQENVEEICKDLEMAAGNLPEIWNKTEDWYLRNRFDLLRGETYILAGAGYLHETANEADIKLMEMLPAMSRSFELEELIHGPQNAFRESMVFFLLADKKHDIDKVNSIDDFLNQEIGFSARIGDVAGRPHDLTIEYRSCNYRMLESVTVFQLLAYYMSKDKGRDLNRRINSSIDQYIRKTL